MGFQLHHLEAIQPQPHLQARERCLDKDMYLLLQ
ncbi:uncharacterized protein METZ01_LOCUS50917 [marine metagenome]|uniref:Uncharacterized protein n=1 Tax=marine metagenome TaxID=408172 RepID=A0A381SAC0_9ZZZZ